MQIRASKYMKMEREESALSVIYTNSYDTRCLLLLSQYY
jgi:hypothetical protein